MELKIYNRLIAVLIILTNIYFIPMNYEVIKSAGGLMGYGLLRSPFLLLSNLLLITAGLTFTKKYKNSVVLLVVNILGLIWNLFWLWLLLSFPKMD